MKFLTPLLFVFGASLTAQAQNCEKFADPARRAECYAHYGPPSHVQPPVYHKPPHQPPVYHKPPVHNYPPPVYHNPPPVYHKPPVHHYPPPVHHYPPPVHHYPPPPVHHYPPPPPPHYGHSVVGPQRTIRWDDRGVNHVPKVLSESMIIHVGGRLVNEVLLRALSNRVHIESVMIRLIDGRYMDLYQFRGTMHDNTELRFLVDRYNSLRVDRIEIRATSPNLIGSRGKMQVILGMAD